MSSASASASAASAAAASGKGGKGEKSARGSVARTGNLAPAGTMAGTLTPATALPTVVEDGPSFVQGTVTRGRSRSVPRGRVEDAVEVERRSRSRSRGRDQSAGPRAADSTPSKGAPPSTPRRIMHPLKPTVPASASAPPSEPQIGDGMASPNALPQAISHERDDARGLESDDAQASVALAYKTVPKANSLVMDQMRAAADLGLEPLTDAGEALATAAELLAQEEGTEELRIVNTKRDSSELSQVLKCLNQVVDRLDRLEHRTAAAPEYHGQDASLPKRGRLSDPDQGRLDASLTSLVSPPPPTRAFVSIARPPTPKPINCADDEDELYNYETDSVCSVVSDQESIISHASRRSEIQKTTQYELLAAQLRVALGERYRGDIYRKVEEVALDRVVVGIDMPKVLKHGHGIIVLNAAGDFFTVTTLVSHKGRMQGALLGKMTEAVPLNPAMSFSRSGLNRHLFPTSPDAFQENMTCQMALIADELFDKTADALVFTHYHSPLKEDRRQVPSHKYLQTDVLRTLSLVVQRAHKRTLNLRFIQRFAQRSFRLLESLSVSPGGQQTDPLWASKYSRFLLFYIDRWNRAALADDWGLLLVDFDAKWNTAYYADAVRVPTANEMESVLVLLGYSCSKCSRFGTIDLVCQTCEGSDVSAADQQVFNDKNKAWNNAKDKAKAQAGMGFDLDAYKKQNPPPVRPVKRRMTMADLARQQQRIPCLEFVTLTFL